MIRKIPTMASRVLDAKEAWQERRQQSRREDAKDRAKCAIGARATSELHQALLAALELEESPGSLVPTGPESFFALPGGGEELAVGRERRGRPTKAEQLGAFALQTQSDNFCRRHPLVTKQEAVALGYQRRTTPKVSV